MNEFIGFIVFIATLLGAVWLFNAKADCERRTLQPQSYCISHILTYERDLK